MTIIVPVASITADIQELVFDAARILLYPVLVGLLACLIWILIELGAFLYEVVQRFRARDLDALETSALRARKAFADGKPRAAYRQLQGDAYSIMVARFLFDLIRNYQTERLAAKPLKLLQEYEFYTVKRLERTRILARIGPVLGLMGALIPLAPALAALAQGNVADLTRNLQIAFSVAVIGLLIGGLAYVIGLVRDRMYSQDVSDLEYLLELLEGNAGRLESGRRRDRLGRWEADPFVAYKDVPDTDDAATLTEPEGRLEDGTAGESRGEGGGGALTTDTAAERAAEDTLALTFDDPRMSWHADDDPFAALGPVDSRESDGGPLVDPPPADRAQVDEGDDAR